MGGGGMGGGMSRGSAASSLGPGPPGGLGGSIQVRVVWRLQSAMLLSVGMESVNEWREAGG